MASGEINVTVTYKTVFLVENGECVNGDHSIDGIFSSEELAQAYIDARKKVDDGYKWGSPTITDFAVNKWL